MIQTQKHSHRFGKVRNIIRKKGEVLSLLNTPKTLAAINISHNRHCVSSLSSTDPGIPGAQGSLTPPSFSILTS